MNRDILLNEQYQKMLNKDGIVKFRFLDEDGIEKLLGRYHQLVTPRTDIPYDILYTCLHNPDSNFRNEMNTQIGELLKPYFAKHFKDVQQSSFTYQIKGLGPQSELYVHQDWSFTDEKQFRTYTFWLPLMDCFAENGTIHAIKGSHLKLNHIRGAGINAAFDNVQRAIRKYMEPQNVSAGEALVFDSALAHYSPPNNTNSIRVCVMTNLSHKDADFMLYFGKENGKVVKVDAYKVPPSFFMLYDDFKSEFMQPPSFAQYAGTHAQPDPQLTEEMLPALFEVSQWRNFSNRVKEMFSL
ncbi:MAG: phytanoyl-CoA dioxygenase family protein [Chitinophagales bacterium]